MVQLEYSVQELLLEKLQRALNVPGTWSEEFVCVRVEHALLNNTAKHINIKNTSFQINQIPIMGLKKQTNKQKMSK